MKRGYFQKVSPGVAPLGAGGSHPQEGLTALGSGASSSIPSSAAPGTYHPCGWGTLSHSK